MILKRVNNKTGEVLNTYELYNDETIIVLDGVLYIVTKEEYDKYLAGELEDFEFKEAGFYTEGENYILKIE